MRPTRRAVSALLVAAPALLVACAQILGFEDVTVGGAGANPDASAVDGLAGPDGAAGGDANGEDGAIACASPLGTPDNCGACGHGCLGGRCEGGACLPVPIAAALTNPEGIALDDGFVYVALPVDDEIRKIDKTGSGSTAMSASSAGGRPQSVASDGANVFWTAYYSLVYGCPAAGCDPPHTRLEFPASSATLVTVVGDRVIWAQPNDQQVLSADRLDAGAVRTLSTSMQAAAFASDGTYLYATEVSGNQVRRVRLDNGVESTLTTSASTPTGIAVGAGALFFGALAPGALVSIPIDGGVQTPFGTATKNAAGLATDGEFLYWADQGTLDDAGLRRSDGCIWRCPLATCTRVDPTPLACNQAGATSVAVDDRAVYWTTFGNTDPTGANFIMNAGSVMKVAKPPR